MPATKVFLSCANRLAHVLGSCSCLQNILTRTVQVPDEHRAVVQDVTKVLHNASLLVDDIEDNSKLRRGIPVAHSV